MTMDEILVERTVSQNFDLRPSFCFMSKNGQLFNNFLHIFF